MGCCVLEKILSRVKCSVNVLVLLIHSLNNERSEAVDAEAGAGGARQGRHASPCLSTSLLPFPPISSSLLPSSPSYPPKLDLNFPPNEHPLKSGRGSKVAALSGPVVRAAANNTAPGICIGRMCGATGLLCPRRGRGEPCRPSFPRGVVGMVLFPANRLLGSRASRRDGGEGYLRDIPLMSSVHCYGFVMVLSELKPLEVLCAMYCRVIL